jgi:predicted  nucleic acid-binding Zn-ribbon protein
MNLKTINHRLKKKCTRCGEGRLKTKNWIRATCVDNNGNRYPDSWTYYECDKCGCRLKIFRNKKVEEPTDEEWTWHCKEDGSV